ncbi:MAG: helix-turn-helix domain-containing protein [Bacteroidota bacterium]
MSNQIYHIETISDICRLAKMPPPRHPLIGVVLLEDLGVLPTQFPARMTYGFYSLGCKKNLSSAVRYGRTSYDFDHGILGYTRPHQLIEFPSDAAETAEGWLVYVHPDFLRGHPLEQKMKEYTFFDYQINEALHLSAEEEATICGIITNLMTEYHQPIDHFSREVMLANLELLLSYSNRFYHRQFITRHQASDGLLQKFEREVRRYFQEEVYLREGLPSVSYFADRLHLSPDYLTEMLKALTGKNTQEHLHLHLIDRAKSLLLAQKSVSETAFALGFNYPQYLSRLFKAKTGLSPKEWLRAG